MQNNAKVGGILSIVAGAIGVLWAFVIIGVIILMLLVSGGFRGDYYYNSSSPELVLGIMVVIYICMGIFYVLVGVLAVVGGVFALKKKHWGWALAGAIGGTIVFLPCGIPAIIFIAMGKPEFQKAAPVVSAPTPTIVG